MGKRKINSTVALPLLAWMLLSSCFVAVPRSQSQTIEIGVRVGDWAKYGNIWVTWTSASMEPDPEHIEQNNTLWFRNEVIDIIDTVIFARQTMQFKNDTQKSSVFIQDVYSGDTNATSLFYVSSGLRAYDSLYPGAVTHVWINETISHRYAGAMREANHVNLLTTQPTEEDPSEIFQLTISHFWDKETGALMARAGAGTYFDHAGNQIASWTRSDEIVETNLWSPEDEPSDNREDQTGTFPYAVAGILATIAISVGVWQLRSRERRYKKRKSRM